MRHVIQVALSLLLLSSHALAQPSTILIPTLYSGPGLFGSRWFSTVIVNNHSATSFESPGVQFNVLCAIPEGCRSDSIPSGTYGFLVAPTPANGLLLRGDRALLSKLAFNGHFAQVSDSVTNGTELPIVRDNQFVQGTIHFPFVALYLLAHSARSTLRIYGPDALPGTAVRVEIRDWTNPSGDPRESETVDLTTPASPTAEPLFPASAQVSLNDDFPFERLRGTWFNIAVVPLPLPSGDLPRIWAFISTTENASQQVSIQTPQ